MTADKEPKPDQERGDELLKRMLKTPPKPKPSRDEAEPPAPSAVGSGPRSSQASFEASLLAGLPVPGSVPVGETMVAFGHLGSPPHAVGLGRTQDEARRSPSKR